MQPFARWLWVVMFVSAVIPPGQPAEGGGVPDKPPSDWVTVDAGPGAEIIEFIQKLPHDPNPLGVRAAHLRDTEYPQAFAATRFFSLDGTPLAGRWAVIYDDQPRPGVILVPGTPQGKESRLTWTIPRLSGGKTTAGPFIATVDVSSLKPGKFGATVALDQKDVVAQQVTLEKK
jgi:hypothetical protein